MHTSTQQQWLLLLLFMHKEVCITNRENRKQKPQKERIYITKKKSEYKRNIEVRKKNKQTEYIYNKDVKQFI